MQKIKSNSKKSQITIFAIVGLVILLVAVFGFLLFKNLKTAKVEQESADLSTLSLQASEIEKLINDCIKKTSFEGIELLGKTGGYLEVPQLINFKGTSFWYLEQANIQPFLNQTQERLMQHINKSLPRCIDSGNSTQYGFSIEKGKPTTRIEFGNNDVTVEINYPIKLSKATFTKELSMFFNILNVRYRSAFEAATEMNERLFDADFDVEDPLKKMDYIKSLDFDISYEVPVDNVMSFTITDKKSITPKNQFYTFTFAAKLGNSSLKKITDLQPKSATSPTLAPYTIYSVDRKAQLDISEGTTVSLNNSDVSYLSVQQTYPNEVTTKDVPVYKQNDKVMQRQDIKYVIDNAIYTFEPSGILFNNREKLTIYYDDEKKDDKGVGILMGKKGFWVPIVSKHEPEKKRVFSNILGFTEFTAIYCSSQQLKKTLAEHLLEPNAGCYISLIIMVIAIVTVVLSFLGPLLGGLATIAGGSGAAMGGIGGLTGIVESMGAALASSFTGIVTASTAFALGVASIAIGVLSMATLVIGSTGAFYDQSPDNCQAFYPACDQTITIEKQEKDGTGMCIPKGDTKVTAGQAVNVCAFIKKCNFIQKTLCMPCSVKCTASFY